MILWMNSECRTITVVAIEATSVPTLSAPPPGWTWQPASHAGPPEPPQLKDGEGVLLEGGAPSKQDPWASEPMNKHM